MNVAERAQRRLEQMAGLELGWRLHLGELLAWVVTALALAMSYHAEEDLGQSLSAFRGWPAYVWPLSVDLADVVCIVLYLEYKRLRLSTWRVGLGLLAATAMMIAANVRSAWPDGTAVLMQAWVPGIALWLWHTMAAGRKPRGAPLDLREVWMRVRTEALGGGDQADNALDVPRERPALDPAPVASDQTSDGEPGSDRKIAPGPERNRAPHTPARVVVRQLLKRHGQRLTADRIAKRAGVSIPHARRLLREERQLRLVREQAGAGPARGSGGEDEEVEG
ncbi:MAG: DUF2637 domain-containing protein [Candidatus Dormibacteraeota bacterium]|nr:DUF2637 domain-containing protein [Candidatus Dormibacteraeota bacterium]